MTDQKRPYRMKQRAALQEQTRLRITESAVELHGSVGPARTSMSAVAERAGVRRSTLYRHFPDERALFAACSAHWSAANPPPDIGAWAQVGDPEARLHVALGELYPYYRRAQPMLDNLLRDEELVPAVKEPFGAFRGFLAAAAETLMTGRALRGRACTRTAAAVGHAVAFATWRSLALDHGMTDAAAVDLMERLVAGAAAR